MNEPTCDEVKRSMQLHSVNLESMKLLKRMIDDQSEWSRKAARLAGDAFKEGSENDQHILDEMREKTSALKKVVEYLAGVCDGMSERLAVFGGSLDDTNDDLQSAVAALAEKQCDLCNMTKDLREAVRVYSHEDDEAEYYAPVNAVVEALLSFLNLSIELEPVDDERSKVVIVAEDSPVTRN